MKEIDWNHPKYAANPLIMGMAWQMAMMKTISEAYMAKYLPHMAAIMKSFKNGAKL